MFIKCFENVKYCRMLGYYYYYYRFLSRYDLDIFIIIVGVVYFLYNLWGEKKI